MDSRKIASKGMVLIFIFCSLLLISPDTQADYQTNLLPGVYIEDNGVDLGVGIWSAPTVYDWNDDGKKDLIIGRKDAGIGYVSFYENYGTDSSPVFNGYSNILSCSIPCTNGGG